MRERKKTGVHGTLEMIPLTWKFNSKQLSSKTLNSRINIIETRAVLNIVNIKQLCKKKLNSLMNTKKVSSARAIKQICLFGQKVQNIPESSPRPRGHFPL